MSESRRKLWIQITAVVLIVSLLASIVLVFADEYVVPEVTPSMTPITTPSPSPSAFTAPGNGEVQDHVDDGGSKEFYTVQTKNSNTFYIVIDKARMDDNVYMLAQVDEEDLKEFVREPAVEETPDVIIGEEVEEIEEKGGKGWVLWLILALLAGAGAFWYFRMEKPIQEETTNRPEEHPKEGLETGESDEYEDLPKDLDGEPADLESSEKSDYGEGVDNDEF